MAYEGVIVNAGVTAFAGACYAVVAAAVHRRKATREPRARATVAFFAIVSAYLLLAALRQAVAYAGLANPALVPYERALFLAVTVPAALAILPLVYLTTYVLTGRSRAADAVLGAFSVVCVVGLAFVFGGGIQGPDVTYWGSDWRIESAVAKVMLLVFVTLPAIAASVLLVYEGSKSESRNSRRVRLVGVSCLIYYAAFTADALGLEGVAFIVVRLATAGAALLGYAAYTPRGEPLDDSAAAPT